MTIPKARQARIVADCACCYSFAPFDEIALPDDRVTLAQPDTPNARSLAAHGADLVLLEPDAHAVAGDEHDVLTAGGPQHPGQLVFGVERNGA